LLQILLLMQQNEIFVKYSMPVVIVEGQQTGRGRLRPMGMIMFEAAR